MSLFLAETLQRKQQAHDLRGQGLTLNQIRDQLTPIGRTTIGEWLRLPRPTDEDVEAAKAASLDAGQASIKARFDPDLFQRMHDEAMAQGSSMNKVITCAVMLYLDCLERARSGGSEPVNLHGYFR